MSHRHWSYKGTNSINPPTSQSHETGLSFSPTSMFWATACLFPVVAEVEPCPQWAFWEGGGCGGALALPSHVRGNNRASVVDLGSILHTPPSFGLGHTLPTSGWLCTANHTPPLKPDFWHPAPYSHQQMSSCWWTPPMEEYSLAHLLAYMLPSHLPQPAAQK